MTGEAPDEHERAEVERMLPWYVAGRLARVDLDRVEAWIARDASLAAQLALIEEDRRSTRIANESVQPGPALLTAEQIAAGAMAEARLPTGAKVIPQHRRAPAAGFGLTRIVDRLSEFFEQPTATGVRWAAAAVMVLVTAQAVAIATLVAGPGSQATYTTAAGGSVRTADGTFALVRFKDTATAAEIGTLLSDNRLEVVSGPKPGMIYRVRIGGLARAAADRDDIIRMLRSRSDLVTLATPAPP